MDASIINAIEATKSEDRKQYRLEKRTESNRLRRGARETKMGSTPSSCTLNTLIKSVGCDGLVHVKSTGVLADTHGGKLCEQFTN